MSTRMLLNNLKLLLLKLLLLERVLVVKEEQYKLQFTLIVECLREQREEFL